MWSLSHPSWVCGLKLGKHDAVRCAYQSHPSWVCGLKPHQTEKSLELECHTLRGCVD